MALLKQGSLKSKVLQRKEPRQKIPHWLMAELRWLSGDRCCVCGNVGKHPHHLDLDRNNNVIDNLAWLCLDHHDDAESKGGLGRKLSEAAIRASRKAHYERIKERNEKWRKLGTTTSGKSDVRSLKKQADLRMVQRMMQTMDVPAIERFVAGLVLRRLDDDFEVHWQLFTSVVESSQFLLHDKMVRKRAMAFRSYWEETLLKARKLYGPIVSQPGSYELIPKESRSPTDEQDIIKLETALFNMKIALRLLLRQVHEKFVEIDVNATSQQARETIKPYLLNV